uniref:Variant surface glycoprotein 1125.2544 n=1 Tax=Trypanosoma brucei TaxID=5691 RepID=A0A1J0R806_9TRYP|nr:variant surface glycoprotein 1125.2544 [Trypanosoma brucei]
MQQLTEILLAIALSIIFVARYTSAADQNAKEFKDMCALVKLLIKTIPDAVVALEPTNPSSDTTSIEKAVSGIVKRIKKLNLTVVEQEIEEVLKEKTKYDSWQKVRDAKRDGYFKTGEYKNVEELRTIFEEIVKNDPPAQQWRATYKLPFPEAKRQKLRPAFRQLIETALALHKEAQALQTRATTSQNKARRAAVSALYGEAYATSITNDADLKPAEPWNGKPSKTAFPWAAATAQHAQMCTPASAATAVNKPGGAVAADIICLCLGDNSATTDYCKLGKQPTGLATGNPQQVASNDWNSKIFNKCTTWADDGQLSQTMLASATTTIISDLGKGGIIGNSAPNAAGHSGHANAAILGAHHLGQPAPACAGANGNDDIIGGNSKGVCVDYKNLLQGDGYIPWMRKVNELSMGLDTIQAISSEGTALVKAAQAVKQQMTTLLFVVDLIASAEEPEKTQLASSPSDAQQNKCAKFNNNETECTNNSCEYDGTKKECKPKPEAETPAAAETGAGETQNAEGKKRSYFTTQPECEAAVGPVPAEKAKFCG